VRTRVRPATSITIWNW